MAVEISDYPLAYFLTWTTYGTWLPGDDRGWTKRHHGPQLPDFYRQVMAALQMTEQAVILSPEQRRTVEETIRKHCRIRGWTLHAVNCRTNHVHVVVSGAITGETAREQFKAYCTRHLRQMERGPAREKWWTERGRCDKVEDLDGLEAVVCYTLEAQDRKDRDH
jgi:hypothetical protein